MLTLIVAVIMSLEADFVQTKTIALMDEPQVLTGHLSYRSPDYMQWAYTSPQTVVWEIKGTESNVSPQIQGLLRMIMSAISGQGQDDKRLQKESKRLFRAVNIEMDEKNNVAKQVELIEKNGDTTIIQFNNVVTE